MQLPEPKTTDWVPLERETLINPKKVTVEMGEKRERVGDEMIVTAGATIADGTVTVNEEGEIAMATETETGGAIGIVTTEITDVMTGIVSGGVIVRVSVWIVTGRRRLTQLRHTIWDTRL